MRRFLLPAAAVSSPAQAAASVAAHAGVALSPTISLLQVALSLFAILALIMGAAWLTRRYLSISPRANTAIKMISGLNLGGRERVLLLEVGEQWIVVGVSPGHISTLATMPRQAADATGAMETGKSFAAAMTDRFKQLRGERET
ncbi:MAG TPA: flagellar biosynthetic protein FliO [Burkholderiales bacterium]|nr:flagellar biosynthetic protein FliO [Burkholderiales bacterium]